MNAIESIVKNKIYAVIRADDSASALKIAYAIIEGGIKSLEITVEKGLLLPALKELSAQKDLTIAAGGIITAKRAYEALECGAQVIVSPVFQDNMAKFCLSNKVAYIATVSTPNEAYNAWKARTPLIKLFPVHSMGRIEYLEDILRPMPFLNVMAAGGLGLNDCSGYLKAGARAVGLGRCIYKDAEPEEIKKRAAFALSQLENI
jgi:2-dehydro-3-deoxyphosphogluconate aldolase/(4S)-4-hydroxy-2-oxoglutarate aldolase